MEGRVKNRGRGNNCDRYHCGCCGAVKAFNTVFAQNQSTAKVRAEQLSAFVAGDDETEKRVVMQLVANIGFDPIDVGTLRSARYLEPMGMLLISLGYDLGMGTNMGIKLIKG